MLKQVGEANADCIGGVSPPSPKGGAEREQYYRKGENKMKNTLLKLSIVFILLAAMLATNVEAIFASSTNSMSLHDYIVRFAEYKSKGNATECARIINEMITAGQIKQEKIASTHGAILQPTDSSSQTSSDNASPMTSTTGWISYMIGQSPPTYDVVTGNLVGSIQYYTNMAGQNPDGHYALAWTNGWNEVYAIPGAEGGEAFAYGAVWNGQSGWMSGNIYVYAYTGVPSWDNYVTISYFDGSTWHYLLPNRQVPNTSPGWVYMGYTSTVHSDLSRVLDATALPRSLFATNKKLCMVRQR